MTRPAPQAGGLRYLQPVAEVLAPMIEAAPTTLVGCSDFQILALEGLVKPHRHPRPMSSFSGSAARSSGACSASSTSPTGRPGSFARTPSRS
jgi:hypothetical protein